MHVGVNRPNVAGANWAWLESARAASSSVTTPARRAVAPEPARATGPAAVDGAAPRAEPVERARAGQQLAQRIREHRSFALALVTSAVVAAGQLAEDVADGATLQMLPPTVAIQRWAVVALVAYIFGSSALVDRTVVRALTSLRPVVLIDGASFDGYTTRMRTLPVRIDAALLIGSAAVVVALFTIVGSDLLLPSPITGRPSYLPDNPMLSALIAAGYTVIGWSFLRLITETARLAWLLARLTAERLEINVFDAALLIPFGNIALALALAPAGAIVILLIGLGSPTTVVGWSVVIGAMVASVLALLLPLRGIHRQMSRAKYSSLAAVSVRIGELYSEVARAVPSDPTEAARMSNAANTLFQMRKAVLEMTTWPFRDTAAFGRAVLIASAPLIYATLSELIKVFLIAPLNQ